MAMGYCEKTFVHGSMETLRFKQAIPPYWAADKN
jgi:hypothetical protein